LIEQMFARASAAKGSDFAELLRRVREAGLLERRPGYYSVKIAVTTALRATAVAVFVVMGDTWWQMATAAFLAIVFAQIGFVGHAMPGTGRSCAAAGPATCWGSCTPMR
jgi:hypothetical protein